MWNSRVDLTASSSEDDNGEELASPATLARQKTRKSKGVAKSHGAEATMDWNSTVNTDDDGDEKPCAVASSKKRRCRVTANKDIVHSHRTDPKPTQYVGTLKTYSDEEDEVDDDDSDDEDDDDVDGYLMTDDATLAAQLQAEEDRLATKEVQEELEQKDASLAARLQSKEEKDLREAKEKEQNAMKESSTGLAYLIVEQLIKITERYSRNGIETIAKDDLVYTAERMIKCQESFMKAGKPTSIYLGYHYTPNQNLDMIRQDGLLTIHDRVKQNNKNLRQVAYFGDGIYTGNNPQAFRGYGDVGLLVAVLKGSEQHVGLESRPRLENGIDTIVGNKVANGPHRDEIILRTSAQVFPMAKYDESMMDHQSFQEILWSFHLEVHTHILDQYFNASETLKPQPVRIGYSSTTADLGAFLTSSGGPFGAVAPAASQTFGAFRFGPAPPPAPPSTQASQSHRNTFAGGASIGPAGFLFVSGVVGGPAPASSFGSLFSSPAPVPACQSYSGFSFGARAPVRNVAAACKCSVCSQTTAISFGYGGSSASLFGSSTAPAPVPLLPGAPATASVTFGATPASQSRTLFGSGPATVPLLGSATAPFTFNDGHNASGGGGWFCSSPASLPAGFSGWGALALGSGSFGGVQAPTPGSLFGSGAGQASGGLFGAAPAPPAVPFFGGDGHSSSGTLFGISLPAASGAHSFGTSVSAPVTQNMYETVNYVAPKVLPTTGAAAAFRLVPSCAEDCSICIDSMADPSAWVIELTGCKHRFHKQCVEASFLQDTRCPVCRMPSGDPQGKGPSGSMTVVSSSIDCSGHAGQGAIKITYRIPSGVQEQYHANPGAGYSGTTRISYLPNNLEGQTLLKRLKYAFSHGLTFTIGLSQTSGAANVVTWASIHHKTSPSGGAHAHGFPDPNYFANCNGELDAHCVPDANSL